MVEAGEQIALRSQALTHACQHSTCSPVPHFYVSVCNEGDMTGLERMQNLQGSEVTNGREREE